MAGALQLDVATYAVRADYFPKEDGSAIAELRHEMAELVASIGECDRLRASREPVASQHLDAFSWPALQD